MVNLNFEFKLNIEETWTADNIRYLICHPWLNILKIIYSYQKLLLFLQKIN